MKFDIHLNLGHFPDSKKGHSSSVYTSIDDMVSFLERNEITHAVILYPRDEYNLLAELAEHIPDVKIYGLQVIMGADSNDPTESIKDLSLDILDPKNKTLCKGIKLASHRGWWRRVPKYPNKKEYTLNRKRDKFGPALYVKTEQPIIESGFDYGYFSREINTLFKRLPSNAIVSMHLQGDPINNCGSVPMMVAKFAYKFPWLKFIMNHVGDYGPESQGGKNKKHIYFAKASGDMNLYAPFRHAHSRALIQACIEYANNMHNIWLDSSCYMEHKAELLKQTTKWCVGSDYPFNKSKTLFLREETRFADIMGQEIVNSSYGSTLYWFENSWEKLYEDHVRENALEDDIQGSIEKVKHEYTVRLSR